MLQLISVIGNITATRLDSAALHPSCLSGMADPAALTQAVSAFQACHFIGMPECEVSSVDQSVTGSLLSCQP